MATTIFFNGRVTAIPGSYLEVDATGLAAIGLGASGIVACIGEAEGGSPYNGDTPIHAISNPGKVGRTFREGDLREAGNILFDPSKDPEIPSGAQEVKFVKVNPATQSTLTLQNADGDVMTVTSKDYGLFTTQINLTVADGTNQGKSYTIEDGDGNEEVYDDVGGDPAFSATYTPGANGADTMTLALDNSTGVTAAFTLDSAGLDSEYTGTYGGIEGETDEQDATITPGNMADVVSTDVADTTQQITLVGIDTGTGDPTTETLTLNGTSAVTSTTSWDKILGVFLDSAAAGTVEVQDNVGSTTLYTLTPGTLDRAINDFGGDVIEVDNDTLDYVLDVAGSEEIIVVGKDDGGVAAAETITLNGTTPVTGTTDWSEIQYLALGELPAASTLQFDGLIWDQGVQVTVVSDDASDTTQTATIYGVDGSGDGQSEQVTLNGTNPVQTTGTYDQVIAVVLSAAAAGTVTVTDGGGLTAFSLTAGDTSKGFDTVDNLAVAGATIDVADSGSSPTHKYLIIGLDASGAAAVEALEADGGTDTTTTLWSEITGVGVGHLASGRTLTLSGDAADLDTATYETVNDVVNHLNTLSGWSVDAGADAGELEISDLDNKSATDVTSEVDFTADLAFGVQALNQSSLVEAETVSGATGAPSNIGPIFLTGGVEGTTTFTEWQAALDLLRDENVNTLVLLTDDEAVHAAALSHAVYMGGPGRKERDVVVGAASGETLTEIKARAVALNSRHARLCVQDIERFNVGGEREQFPPYFTACIAAGMQAGSSVGTPLTFKYLNILDMFGDDDTYTIQDDANDLIESGICAIEKVQGVGFRWLRNVTTYLIDDNIAYVEASVNEAVNYTSRQIRDNLEAMVGKKGFAGTTNAAASIVIQTLGLLSDPQDPIITSWRNLTIVLEDDVMTVDVEIAPVNPINFIKTTLHLVSASFSAAA